jgi:preprotein translocase subunit SecA
VSIEKSEELSRLLSTYDWEWEGKKRKGIPHQVLNARFHEQEAGIVADAGVPGAVTIATNMAGRGTDIQLGGNLDMRLANWRQQQKGLGITPTHEDELAQKAELEVEIGEAKARALAAGGLFVLGTERHESRRIDNQLRGRTGRQGDPGRSKFFLSCEDDLLRIFAGERLDAIMRTFGVQEGEAITHKWLNNAIATAQKRVEQRNYEIRKNLLKYDDVVNDQRKAVFEQRQEFMEATDLSEIITEMRHDVVDDFVARYMPPKAYAEQWDIEGLDERVQAIFGLTLPLKEWASEEGFGDEEMRERLTKAADAYAAEREVIITPEQMRSVEKNFLLQMIDLQWREHLMHLDHLRNVIGLRGYGQRDPLNEYKTEAFSLFEKLLGDLRTNTTRWLMTVEIAYAEPEPLHSPEGLTEVHLDPLTGENAATAGALPEGLSPQQREALPVSVLPEGWEFTARNGACPCGSGKKFKHCHGALV